MVAEWVSPRGEVLALTDNRDQVGWFTLNAIGGWGAGPVEIVSDAHPRGGATVRHIRDEPRDIHWPLHIFGQSHMEFTRRWWQVVRAFTDTKRYGPGILRVIRPDGSSRQIEAFYLDGLNGLPGENWLSANPVVTLHCPGGYWQDAQPVPETWRHQSEANFYDPFMSISSGRLIGATTIDNPGDADAWPVWTLTGPAEQLVATNDDTGASFELTYSLQANETVTITTQRPRVRGPNGEKLSSALNWPEAVLWPLRPGTNNVTFQVNGADDGTTIDLEFAARYESC